MLSSPGLNQAHRVNGTTNSRVKSISGQKRESHIFTAQVEYSTPVLESLQEGHFRQVAFPHSIGRRAIWQDIYIDPGLEFRNSYLTWVPEAAIFVLLLFNFQYDKGENWPAQRVLKVPPITNLSVKENLELAIDIPGERSSD
jgi:hypothetical protein